MDMSVNAHEKNPNGRLLACWFIGTTALKKGQGVCYDWDAGTETVADGRRSNRVELPTILNARYFAGVAARSYSAKSTGQLVELWSPGSFCEILAAVTTELGVGLLTCEAGGTYAGYFRLKGFEGEGSAVPLQVVTGTAGTPLPCLAKLQEGAPSGLAESVVTNTDGLLDGGATTIMVGGVSYLDTDISTGGDATFTLADGIIPGQKKAFVARQTQTNFVDIAPASAVQGFAHATPTTALTHAKFNADLEEVTLQWNAFDTSGLWYLVSHQGADLT